MFTAARAAMASWLLSLISLLKASMPHKPALASSVNLRRVEPRDDRQGQVNVLVRTLEHSTWKCYPPQHGEAHGVRREKGYENQLT